MEPRIETAGKIAIILAPDDKGLQKVFGISSVRRLALLIQKLGIEEIHFVGQVKTLQPNLSDLVPQERFHPAEGSASLVRIAEKVALPDRRRVLTLIANQVIVKRPRG